MAKTVSTTDRAGAGGIRIFKVTKDYAANANVPKVLMPYVEAMLKVIPGDGETDADITAEVYIEKNGIPVVTGPEAGTDVEVYPGVVPGEGDIKTASGLSVGDILSISYRRVRYAESDPPAE